MMPRHDPEIVISQMYDHTTEAIDMAANYGRNDLETNRMFVLALTRLLEVIGEAASRLPEEFRNTKPEIQWRLIIDLRNRLIHGYDTINFDVLWKIIRDDLPDLREKLLLLK